MQKIDTSAFIPFPVHPTSAVISFEGIDGSGKTTQISLLKNYLESLGKSVHILREPGASSLGESIRSLILNSKKSIDPLSEMFLFLASRNENIISNILPMCKTSDTIIILDRFIDSTLAYQAIDILRMETILKAHSLPPLNHVPNITFYLDFSSEKSYARRLARNEAPDYFESKAHSFLALVRKNYLYLTSLFPNRIKLIDADDTIDSIHQKIINSIKL